MSRNEAETRAELIDPALKQAGWGDVAGSRIRREEIAPGRLIGGGKRTKQDIADYVLYYKNQKLAVIEAKKEGLGHTEGLGQAKQYAQKLQTPFTYSTNGKKIYEVNMTTGHESDVDRYPTPDELWDRVFGETEAKIAFWRDRFASVPFEDKGGQWQPRYYQHNAITKMLDALTTGEDRILLTLATGTGKTAIAFQIAWKLFHSRWNLTDWRDGVPAGEEPKRRPRVLFLADRNILANQAFNAFSAFQEDALVRIDPQIIRKKGQVPKNGSIFFTIFQTFMSGSDEEGNSKPSFGDYPPDFFDMIVIDECHRGGANDESNWRDLLEYFAPAVQLGLTATPRRKHNADTYAYFGKPVYEYSLKEGINDGYLTPFKVKQISTTLDDYIYTSDDTVVEGDIEAGRRYEEDDFNKVIEIKAREQKRVELFMDMIDQSQKTLVFCATQVHALAVRDLINQIKDSTHTDYCVRVTANDGEIGEKHLRTFQDNEKTIPTILTTSQKLSTGVDARNIRNIVLMRPINSMIEFKQIIGRGTRIFDGKDFFTVYDFVKAYMRFSDPDWDGPAICETCQQDPCQCEVKTPKPCATCGESPCTCERDRCPDCGCITCRCGEPSKKVKVELAKGKAMAIDHMMMTSYWHPDGSPISSAEFLKQIYGDLPALFKDEAQLRKLWSHPETRRKLLEQLQDQGYGEKQLAELATAINAKHSDLYDVLAQISFQTPAVTREHRAKAHTHRILSIYPDKQQQFLEFVLEQYVKSGIGALDDQLLPELIELKYETPHDAKDQLGEMKAIRDLFIGFQKYLYENVPAA